MTILDELVVRAYPYKMMNVHPALIPSFCGKGYYGLRVHEEALKKGVKECVFDRGGFIYQGKIKALADAAREAGLNF